jgi:hypothetical protein
VGVTKKPSGSHVSGQTPMFMPKTSKISLLDVNRMPVVFSAFIAFCIMNLFQKDKL